MGVESKLKFGMEYGVAIGCSRKFIQKYLVLARIKVSLIADLLNLPNGNTR